MADEPNFPGIEPGPNPERYREMSKPFPTAEAANTALDAFYKDLGALRVKHRLADVYVVASVNVLAEDGDEMQTVGRMMWGDELKALMLTAWAMGTEQAMHEERVGRLLKAGARREARLM